MSQIVLNVKKRDKIGNKVASLRKEGLIPAVLYGKGVENQNLQVNERDFSKVYESAGSATLLSLDIPGGEPVKVLVKDISYNTVSDLVEHIDFFQVDMNEKVTTKIDLVFVGRSRAVAEKGGVLIRKLTRLEVEGLPGDLVKEVEVDLGVLEDLNQSIKVGDLVLPNGLAARRNLKEVVASIAKSRQAAKALATVGSEEEEKEEGAKEESGKDKTDGKKEADKK